MTQYRNFMILPGTAWYMYRRMLMGYSARCVNFTEDSGVYGYDIVDIGGEGRMLYGLNEYGSPWLAIRSGLTMADQVELPWTTQEIFSYAMEKTCSESGSFTLNWEELWGLWAFDPGHLRIHSLEEMLFSRIIRLSVLTYLPAVRTLHQQWYRDTVFSLRKAFLQDAVLLPL